MFKIKKIKIIKNQKGSALMIVMLIFFAIFIISFSSGYLVFLNIFRSSDSSSSLKAHQAALAGIEKAHFEVITNDFNFGADCVSNVFSSNLRNGSSYTINCVNNGGNLEFYSVGSYEKSKVTLKINCINANEECLPHCREGSYCGGEKLLTTGGNSCSGDCIIHEGLLYSTVFNATTSECWLDRNLGATQVATAMDDTDAYGDLYQWGRLTDGHQIRTSDTTSVNSSSDIPGHNDFILELDAPYDWRDPQNNNLWQGVDGINNPCPTGFRIPTEAEWEAERLSWSSSDYTGAFASPLKLTPAGMRYRNDGSISDNGVSGKYWSSSADITASVYIIFTFNSSNVLYNSIVRSSGLSVRCIKN